MQVRVVTLNVPQPPCKSYLCLLGVPRPETGPDLPLPDHLQQRLIVDGCQRWPQLWPAVLSQQPQLLGLLLVFAGLCWQMLIAKGWMVELLWLLMVMLSLHYQHYLSASAILMREHRS